MSTLVEFSDTDFSWHFNISVTPQNDLCKVERSSFQKQTTGLFLWLVKESVFPNHDLDLHVNFHMNLPRTVPV